MITPLMRSAVTPPIPNMQLFGMDCPIKIWQDKGGGALSPRRARTLSIRERELIYFLPPGAEYDGIQ